MNEIWCLNFLNILWIFCKKYWFIFIWVRPKSFSHDTGRFSQALNNSSSHDIYDKKYMIRKFQISYISVVSLRVHDLDEISFNQLGFKRCWNFLLSQV